jgi:DNA repair photolyase
MKEETMAKINEITAKSILNKSKIFDYCLNPYTGCQIGCLYCYARLFMGRYSGHKEPWSTFVDVKVNAPELLAKQLARTRRGRVWIASVCDPYQPVERKYRLTRRCLEALVQRPFPVIIQTKSDLVLRDLDLLERLPDVEVGMTITTDDERLAKIFEPGASSVSNRVKALGRIHAAGIKTYAFIGPILPGDPQKLGSMLDGKVDRVLMDRMNYVSSIKGIYKNLGLEWAISDEFFDEYKHRLTFELRRRAIAIELHF